MPEQLPRPPRRIPISLEPRSPVPIVIGIVLCATGFVLIAYCWSQVALRMHVADQLAYIVSSGFTGVGLICVGAVLVSIQVRRRDAEQQFRRLEELAFTARGERPAAREPRPSERERRRLAETIAAVREPVNAALATSLAAVIAGFGLVAFAWYRVSGEMDVAVQMPYVVSGGIAGLALIAAGCLFAHVLISRGLENTRGDAVADIVTSVTQRAGRGKR